MEVLAALAHLAEIATFTIEYGGILLRDLASDDVAQQQRARFYLRREPRFTDEQREVLRLPGTRAVLHALVIDPDLLSTLTDGVNKARDAEKESYNTSDRRKREEAFRKAERQICSLLNIIRLRNRGRIPKGEWKRWWDQYRCLPEEI